MTSDAPTRSIGDHRLRVLVVDNSEIDRVDHVQALNDWGYIPVAAEGDGNDLLEDAKRKARLERCHAAIVDLRLFDDQDEEDKSGLKLAEKLKPAKSVIVTGYANVPDTRQAAEQGAVLVGKREGKELVREELEKKLRDVCRTSLTLNPEGWLEKHVTPYLRSDQREQVQNDEVRDVIAMLFPEAHSIYTRNLQKAVISTPLFTNSGLRSSSHVILAKPDGIASIIIKFASPNAIRRERENYTNFVEGRFEENRHPQLKNHKRFWNVGALVYSFLGVGNKDIWRFDKYYMEHSVSEINTALSEFFKELWEPLYREKVSISGTLFDSYEKLWNTHNDRDRLRSRFDGWKGLDKYRRFEKLESEYLEPRRWLAEHHTESVVEDGYKAVVHGDFHSQNIFVDKSGHVWVLDFERTGWGHILADYVELEHDLLRRLSVELDISTLFHVLTFWASPWTIDSKVSTDLLTSAESFRALLTSVPDSNTRANIEKTLRVILELRKIAAEMFSCRDQQEYYWALLLDTLYAVSRLDSEFKTEDKYVLERELLTASILCHRLRVGNSKWPPDEWEKVETHTDHVNISLGDQNPKAAEVEPNMSITRILFLAASPTDLPPPQATQEYRKIETAILRAEHAGRLRLLPPEYTVQGDELGLIIGRTNPTILHFCMHGTSAGDLVATHIDGEAVLLSQTALETLLEILNRREQRIRCVILNACSTLEQAKRLAQHADIVIGTTSKVDNATCRTFARNFYEFIGQRKSVKESCDLACLSAGIDRNQSPPQFNLIPKKGIDPDEYYLV